MDWTSIVSGILGAAIGGSTTAFFTNYFRKKDIQKITNKVEEIKAYHQLKNQLQTAALDERLKKHQEAYALWWELVHVSSDANKCDIHVSKCQDWWVNNNLYLTAEAREAFYRAYISAMSRPGLLMSKEPGRGYSPETREEIKKNFEEIRRAGELLQKALDLPPIEVPSPPPIQ